MAALQTLASFFFHVEPLGSKLSFVFLAPHFATTPLPGLFFLHRYRWETGASWLSSISTFHVAAMELAVRFHARRVEP